MSDNSVLGIYTFEGIFEGKPVYEYAHPQEHALHKCMLFLLQEGARRSGILRLSRPANSVSKK